MYIGEDEHAFRILADNLDEAIWLSSADGNEILFVNPVFERIWLRPRADLLRAPRSWLDALHREDRPRVEQAFDALATAPAGTGYNEHFRLLRGDGATRWIHQRILSLEAPAGAASRRLSLARDITGLRQRQEAPEGSNNKPAGQAQLRETINEEQRTRIAREIHDEFGQALTALNLDVHWLIRRCPHDEQIQGKLGQMRDLIEHTAKTVQDFTQRLRPADLGAFGLDGALNGYISRFRQQNAEVRCHQSIRLDGVRVDRDSAIALYRILQEALTNISRHARARTVRVEVSHDGHTVTLAVEDDGVGISESELGRNDAWGLIGMRERADALGGNFAIRSTPGRGTQLAVILPLREAGGADAMRRPDVPE